MIPKHMFIKEHAVTLADDYELEFAECVAERGINQFRDWSSLYSDAQKLVTKAFGLSEDACWDEEGIFDQGADYLYGLTEEVETIMLGRAFPGVVQAAHVEGMEAMDKKPTRRAEEVLYECADLMAKKGAAYNGFPQSEYYPYGLRDIWYMCFTKVKRLESQIVRDGEKNFEGIEDSARDLINYAAFLVEFAEGKMDGQNDK